MRFKVILEGDILPIDYRNHFMSFIKEALKVSDLGKEYLENLYKYEEGGEIKNNKSGKPFCFAVRFLHDKEEFKKDKNIFYIKSDIEFYISSTDIGFIVALYNGLLSKRLYPFKMGEGEIQKRKSIVLLREKNIKENKVIFKTLSPILIEDKNDKPLLPISLEDGSPLFEESEDFVYFLREFNYISDTILRSLRGYGLKEKLDFKPVKLRKEVVKHRIREKNIDPKLYTFTCFSGSFELYGDKEDLNYLYQLGFGLRRAQGFGMVEVE